MKLPKLTLSNGVLWDGPGLRLEIQRVIGTSDRFLKLDDLNPETQIRRRLSRMDTIRIGLFFIWRAIFANPPAAK